MQGTQLGTDPIRGLAFCFLHPLQVVASYQPPLAHHPLTASCVFQRRGLPVCVNAAQTMEVLTEQYARDGFIDTDTIADRPTVKLYTWQYHTQHH